MSKRISIEGVVTDLGPSTYEKIKAGLGGNYFDAARYSRGVIYVDDEGLLKSLPQNDVASRLTGQMLVGPAVLLTPKETAEDREMSTIPHDPHCNEDLDEDGWCAKCDAVTLQILSRREQ